MPDEVEQTVPPVQDPVTPAAPPQNPGPWDADLAAFQDPTIRSQVDALLRTRIQPRMTQLEQSAAEHRDAQILMNDLINSPDETMTKLAAELNWTPEQVAEQVAAAAEPSTPTTLDPRVERAVALIEQQENEALYMEQFNQIKAANPDIVDDVYHQLVIAANGNFDQATQLYNHTVELLGPKAPEADPAAPAPQVLGGDGLTTPPIQKEYKNLGDAVDDFLNDLKATADPPPVG